MASGKTDEIPQNGACPKLTATGQKEKHLIKGAFCYSLSERWKKGVSLCQLRFA